MTRQFSGDKLVIASHNPGKVIEIRDLLGNFDIEIISAADFGLPEPEETSLTFNENAELKARAAALGSHLPALADDSGLSVAALDGDPGIYSARWAGPDKDFALAMKRVMDALSNKGGNNMDKGAKFVCALSLCWPDGHCETFEGVVQGKLQFPPRGDKGFGYDPIFVANGYTSTFAEIDPAEKHRISHRADAFHQLVEMCFN
ncbi:MAG: non-canonical purine NTP pyrophosphatase, RdgB/HAM1 family [Rhodospirillaceae bacterium]|nr:non-canonical purine NTP pyrophosphatase, RdgB/HAM1 family [Rhodospirillaceae bacterium]